MKGRGGSGDGWVVFACVYSGLFLDQDLLKIISPPVVVVKHLISNKSSGWR